MRRSRKRVWFFVAPGAELLDITGPWEVLQHADDVLGRSAYEVELFGPGGPELRTRHGLVIELLRRQHAARAAPRPGGVQIQLLAAIVSSCFR